MLFCVADTAPTVAQIQRVTALLGREPRGLRAIAVSEAGGEPVVIRVASVVDGRPFPTLYWLVGARLSLQLDRLEAAGWIARLQAEVDASADLRVRMMEDHKRHRAQRARFLMPEEAQLLEDSGMDAAVSERGIGGIADPDRIRCLHTWYAAHLVNANAIGELIDRVLAEGEYLATD